jgi:hypothetical protein
MLLFWEQFCIFNTEQTIGCIFLDDNGIDFALVTNWYVFVSVCLDLFLLNLICIYTSLGIEDW